MKRTAILFLATGFLAMSCHTGDKLTQNNQKTETSPKTTMITSPSVLVYKTSKDYHNNVPIILSADKKEVVSYPDPRDLKHAMPTPLSNGYWLDNRGIGKNVAFLKLTYEEYAALPAPPSLTELDSLVIDRNPLTELYDCGPRQSYKNVAQEINEIITNGTLDQKCKLVD